MNNYLLFAMRTPVMNIIFETLKLTKELKFSKRKKFKISTYSPDKVICNLPFNIIDCSVADPDNFDADPDPTPDLDPALYKFFTNYLQQQIFVKIWPIKLNCEQES
jgi:hypothetical protein